MHASLRPGSPRQISIWNMSYAQIELDIQSERMPRNQAGTVAEPRSNYISAIAGTEASYEGSQRTSAFCPGLLLSTGHCCVRATARTVFHSVHILIIDTIYSSSSVAFNICD